MLITVLLCTLQKVSTPGDWGPAPDGSDLGPVPASVAQAVDGAGAGRRGHGELPAALLHRPGQGQAQGEHQPEALHEHQLQLGGRGW